MIVYHGTNMDFDEIDLKKCKKYKDFGQGFYVTVLEGQAERMAKRTAARYGGLPTVIKYEFDYSQLEKLRYMLFETPNSEWAVFVANNRNPKFKDFTDILSNHDNKYDVVCGAVADNDVLTTTELYSDGYISAEIVKERLRYKELTNQYSFHTVTAIGLLRKIGAKTYE